MKYTLGIDIGGSITKIVGFCNNKLISTQKSKAEDQITSAYGAFGKFLSTNSLKIEDIEKIVFTGVGATFLKDDFFSIPSIKADEFKAIGLGGKYISGTDNAIIVSMGTGTAFVKVSGNEITHLGGSGVGGGTIQGLAGKMLGVSKFQNIIELAASGSLSKVDLSVGDISKNVISNMPMNVTASNFGKVSDLAGNSDIALGILNLVLETIGMLSIFAAKQDNINNIVLTGNLTSIPHAAKVFKMLENLHKVKFLIPKHSEFATAIGAALCTCGET